MKADKFIGSWPALWLWMHHLNQDLVHGRLGPIYTFHKGRLDIHYTKAESRAKLSWEKQGNQAILLEYSQSSLPKRRVKIFRKLPPDLRILTVLIHTEDRILRINLQNNFSIIIGFYPAALNIYLYKDKILIETFLKQPLLPEISNSWISAQDALPETIPGPTIKKLGLLAARDGLWYDPENQEISFQKTGNDQKLDIQALVIQVLRQGQKPKMSPEASLNRTANTVIKRWKKKLENIDRELSEARSWPTLESELQILQNAMGVNPSSVKGILHLPAQLSPTGFAIDVKLEPHKTLQQTIADTAKKIRKYKAKVPQLEEITPKIRADIRKLEQILVDSRHDDLKVFLEEHGEALERSGHRQTKRKPYKKFRSPSGYDILVGRSSSDNDALTFKVAGKNDWWFHARQVRGSHVILRTGNQVPQALDIRRAAQYAALNSKAKHSGIIVVQYCQRKHLSKPKGSSPGTVLVQHEKSITVDLASLS